MTRARRAFLGVAAAAALGAVGVLLVGFVWPGVTSEVELGSVEAFPRGSVTSFYLPRDGDGLRRLAPGETVETTCGPANPLARWQQLVGTVIHVVSLEDGRLLALSGKSGHLQEMVPWRPDFSCEGQLGWFREPCHGDTYAMDGTRVFGPAPRSLDRLDLRIEDGQVVVDTRDVTRGDQPGGSVHYRSGR